MEDEEYYQIDFNEDGSENISKKKQKRNKRKRNAINILFDWLDSFVISLVIVIFIFTFIFIKVEVDGESMRETLQDHDQLIITDFNYTPQRSDIVIISRNYANTTEGEKTSDKPIVKRVIGLEGDTIEIKDQKVFVNGYEIAEEYLDMDITRERTTPEFDLTSKVTVPEGCVFVLGDNRWNSHDSRRSDIGFVKTDYILGKVLWRIFPIDKATSFIDEQ